MSLIAMLRRGEGRFWGSLKALCGAMLAFHMPARGPLRPLARGAYGLHVAAREGLAFALRFFWYEPLFRGQCKMVGKRFYMEQLPYLSGQGRIVIGDDVRLSGKSSIGFSNRLHGLPELIIGDSTFIGHNCSFSIAESVTVGHNCLIAGGTAISDFDGHPLNAARRRAGEPTPPDQIMRVVIGDDVWIGAAATILKGVSIGDRSIVAARAVVTRDVPADVIVAGNPARAVRSLNAFMVEDSGLLDPTMAAN
jgi:acetyltransferase-like isoleucine patch superfamily enzyme